MHCPHHSPAPEDVLVALPNSQSEPGRHRCASCAYASGYAAGKVSRDHQDMEMAKCDHGQSAPLAEILALPTGQGGPGRHKCVICAYTVGYRHANESGFVFRPSTTAQAAGPAAFPPLPSNVAPSDAPPRKRLASKQNNSPPSSPASPDHLRQNEQNHALGLAGEHFVLEFERHRIQNGSNPALIDHIEHVALTQGDAAGYDIKSYNEQGEALYIEVKTTMGDISTPFYLTANELALGKGRAPNYAIYRVFNFHPTQNRGQLYIIQGDPEKEFHLVAQTYRAFR